MRVISVYSHKRAKSAIEKRWPEQLEEVLQIISSVDAEGLRLKKSKEKTMPGKILYSPIALNSEFRKLFSKAGWQKVRIEMKTSVRLQPNLPASLAREYVTKHRGFREMDFVKDKLGVEVQFGKYAFMVYNVLAKMTIFRNRGVIEAGIEIVPMARLAAEMSTGVSYFEQIKADLQARGVADIDIPVLVLGIDTERADSESH